jgi:hypothetical protein
MSHDYELEQLRLRIERIEAELAIARRQLEGLSQAAAPAPAVVPAPLESAAPVATVVEPPLLPPLLTPAATIPAEPPVVRPPARPLRDWLAQLQLWPPSGDDNTEARLGAWWATRLGALLAVVGVVFFGVYVSRNTAAWVKLAELLVVTIAVLGAGLWLERRVPKFGAVIVGAGLALLYFSAVAAHVVPATQVLTDPFSGAVAQLAAVAVLVGFALWRRSEATAVAAVALGFATTFFTCYCGMERFSLWSALLLAVGAVALKPLRGWRSPSFVALPLVYGVYVVLGLFVWARTEVPPTAPHLWLPLLAGFAVFWARDAIGAWRGAAPLTADDRVLQNLNSSAAIGAGFLVTLQVLPAELVAFYFWAAGVMLAVTLGWSRIAEPGSLVAVAACKMAGLLALGWLTHLDGHLRWLVLLTQAFVLLVAVRVTGIRGLRVLMIGVWLLALGLFVAALSGRTSPPPALTTLVFLGFSAALLAYDHRWLAASAGFNRVCGVVLGLAAWWSGSLHGAAGWSVAWLSGLTVLLLVAGWPARSWTAPAVAAGLTLAGAHLAMFDYRPMRFPPWQLWTNGAALMGVVGLVGLAWDRLTTDETVAGRRWRAVLAVAAALVLQVIFFKGMARAQDLAATAASALVLLALSPWARRWPLAIAATLGLAYGLYLHHPFRVRPDYPWLFVATVGAWLLPVIWHCSALRRELVRSEGWSRALPWIQSVVATWITVFALRSNFSGPTLLLLTAASAGAVFALAWRPGVIPALWAASALLFTGVWPVVTALLGPGGNSLGQGPLSTALLTLAAVGFALPLLGRRVAGAELWRQVALPVHALGGLGLLCWFFAASSGPLAPYATVLWGGVASAIFILGLFARERVYRLTGLLGLAACIPRVFLIDLDSTLYRIVAFVVLGLVLLWVGFSYHRFRHLIADEDGPPTPQPPAAD